MSEPAKFWQRFLEKSLQNVSKSGDIQAFSQLCTLKEKVKWFIQDDIVSNRLSAVKEFKESLGFNNSVKKNSCHSEEDRKKGNDCFKEKRYQDALKCYNQSVSKATSKENSTSLALALANRSACLYHLGKYQECVTDIQYALDAGYPLEFHYKLYQRKAQCLFNQGFKDKALQEFENARSAIDASKDLTVCRKERILKDYEDWLRKFKENTDSNDCRPATPETEHVLPTVTGSAGTVLLNTSNLVQLQYTADEGRHLVASQLINPGDTLLVEKPYAAVLLPDNYSTHCHHCFVKLPLNPLFCNECTTVRYCGESCRKVSWKIYHHGECRYLDLMHAIGVAHLSLRIILKTGLNSLLDFREEYKTILKETSTSYKGLSLSGKYEHGYLAIYELVHHADQVATEDLYQYTLTAILLLEVLKSTGFFTLTESVSAIHEKLTENEIQLYIGGLLLRHILQIICNAHAITELKMTKDETNDIVSTQDQVRIATGLYPTASLMNHSCDPSVISSFQKDTMILRAVKRLNPGEEVYNCYGPHFRRMCKNDRQEVLRSQYQFVCNCIACEEEPEQLEFSQAIRCSECSGPVLQQHKEYYTCTVCKHEEEAASIIKQFTDAEELFFKGVMLLEKEQFQDALVELLRCLKQREKLLYKYNQHLGHTYDCVARCLAALGQFGDSAKYLDKSVEITKVIYGKDSIELANELQKLAEVQVNNGDFIKAKETCLPAISIFETYYGTSHNSTMQLKELFLQLTISDT